jgi:hypothetical protein
VTSGRERRAALPALAVALAAGCGPVPRWVVPVPVGPAPVVSSATGDLLVYSADDAIETADADHPHHRRYLIRSESGTELRTVLNQSGPFGQDPQEIALPPGHYLVDTSATNFGPVRVPVVIEQGRLTVVHLDGDAESDPVPEASAVRLPNGNMIGARATGPH